MLRLERRRAVFCTARCTLMSCWGVSLLSCWGRSEQALRLRTMLGSRRGAASFVNFDWHAAQFRHIQVFPRCFWVLKSRISWPNAQRQRQQSPVAPCFRGPPLTPTGRLPALAWCCGPRNVPGTRWREALGMVENLHPPPRTVMHIPRIRRMCRGNPLSCMPSTRTVTLVAVFEAWQAAHRRLRLAGLVAHEPVCCRCLSCQVLMTCESVLCNAARRCGVPGRHAGSGQRCQTARGRRAAGRAGPLRGSGRPTAAGRCATAAGFSGAFNVTRDDPPAL